MITNISSSVVTARMNNRNGLYRNGSCVSACHDLSDWSGCWLSWCCKCCTCCKCSNRVLTCCVITILPIAITSTLICIFMMQKTNLHEYAIYSFVVFCVAFVFPFALFFVTVVLNKIYNCFKRGNERSINNYEIHEQHMSHNSEYVSLTNNHTRLCQSPSPIRIDRIRNLESDYFMHSRVLPLPPYYFSLQCPQYDRHLTVSLPPLTQITAEDSPPSYEMAMLCPSIPLNQLINTTTRTESPPPPPYFEKIT